MNLNKTWLAIGVSLTASLWENAVALRSGRYKIVRPVPDAPAQLFDLEKDIGETTDLAAELPGVTAKLKQQLEQWEKRLSEEETSE